MGKEVSSLGSAWLHPEFLFTLGIFARAGCLPGSWGKAMHVMSFLSHAGSRKHPFQGPTEFGVPRRWPHTRQPSCPPVEPEFVRDSRLRESCVFLPFSFSLSLGGDASPVAVWRDLRGCGEPGSGVFIMWEFTSLFNDSSPCQDACRLGLFPSIQMLALSVN